MKRTLIVNADDFGYTHGINVAIDHCSRDGILRSATVMANGSAFEEAVAIARKNENIRVGVHLTLTELKPLANHWEVEGLVDEMGFLPSSPERLWLSIIQGKVTIQAIRNELDRQVTKVLDHGVPISHLDSHQHVHVLPEVLEAACEVASRYSISWIRNPFDVTPGLRLFPMVFRENRRVFSRQHLKAKLVFAFRHWFFRCLRKYGISTPDSFYGVSLTGVWNDSCAVRLIQGLPPGVTEWMVHPGECDADLKKKTTRLLKQRETERDLLISPLLKKLLAEYKINLKPYGEHKSESAS